MTIDARHAALRRALNPTRRHTDTDIAEMLRRAADAFTGRGEHDTAERLRARADELGGGHGG